MIEWAKKVAEVFQEYDVAYLSAGRQRDKEELPRLILFKEMLHKERA